MRTAIIVSKKDPAGLNIKEELEKYNLKKLNTSLNEVETESIISENIDKKIKADLFIFATKHESESKTPSLSTHSPGNWNKAELGGKPKTLCIAPALYLKKAFLELNNLVKNLNYQTVMECTHHGPFLEKPVMFIEIGSSLEQWQDKKAAKIIAQTIINLLKKPIENYKTAIAFGGTHYCTGLQRILLETNIALGHICPKYQANYLNEDLILQAFNKTIPKPSLAIIDWKGLTKEDKKTITYILEKHSIPWKRTKWIR